MGVTLSSIWALLAGTVQITGDKIERLYRRLIIIAIGAFCLVVVQWIINIAGAPGFNFVFFFAVAFVLAIMGFSPIRGLGAGAVIGTTFAYLRDEDKTRGAARGIVGWMRAVVMVIFIWWVISGGLATFPFEESPLAFWPIAAMGCIIAAVAVVYNWKSRFFPYLVVLYASVVLVSAAFSAVPERTIVKYFGSSPQHPRAASAPQVVQTQTISDCTPVTYRYLPSLHKPNGQIDTLDLVGDRCVHIPKDGVMTIQPRNRTEILLVDFDKLDVELQTADGRKLDTVTLERGPKVTCFHPDWRRAVLKPQGERGGTVRIRVGVGVGRRTPPAAVSCP